MAEQPDDLELAFHFESDNAEDLNRSADLIREQLSALPSVREVRTQVSGQDRLIDPVSAVAILVTVRLTVSELATITAKLDELLNNVKNIGKHLGLRLWVEHHRKKVDVDNLTPEQLAEWM